MSEVLSIWQSGGWVMVSLFALAALLYMQAFQLILLARRYRIHSGSSAHWWKWVRNPREAEGRVREIIEYTQHNVTTSDQVQNRFDEIRRNLIGAIDRRTIFVSMLVAAAPLMGLLGTVLGMLQTFAGISTSGGTETAGVVAAGISEALVTTQAGLTIALPGLFVVMLIQRNKHNLEAAIARLESLTLSTLRLDSDEAQVLPLSDTAEGGRQWPDAA